MRRSENIGRQKENKMDHVDIKLKRRLVIEFRLIIGIGDSIKVIAIVV